jgi:hypothetical protein
MSNVAELGENGYFYLNDERQVCPILSDSRAAEPWRCCIWRCARFAISSKYIEGRKVWFLNCCGVTHRVETLIIEGKEQV